MFTPNRIHQAGISLVELVIFIVIVGVAVAGVLSVMNFTSRHSADPMVRKQALAIAEALLEEIELQPFTYCHPGDTKALTASDPSQCTGSTAGSEDTLPTTSPLGSPRTANNVADYTNFSMSPIVDIIGTPITGLGAYTASVSITQMGSSFPSVTNPNDVLKIDVRVVSGSTDITLTGYRFRYAPNAVP